MATAEELAEMKELCQGAEYMREGGTDFVHLPSLSILAGRDIVIRDALLSLGAHTGYTSRLYLSALIPGHGQNWTQHVVFGRTWHTPSWNNVPPGRPMEMLQQHMKVYK
jgi:hypothetical protein